MAKKNYSYILYGAIVLFILIFAFLIYYVGNKSKNNLSSTYKGSKMNNQVYNTNFSHLFDVFFMDKNGRMIQKINLPNCPNNPLQVPTQLIGGFTTFEGKPALLSNSNIPDGQFPVWFLNVPYDFQRGIFNGLVYMYGSNSADVCPPYTSPLSPNNIKMVDALTMQISFNDFDVLVHQRS